MTTPTPSNSPTLKGPSSPLQLAAASGAATRSAIRRSLSIHRRQIGGESLLHFAVIYFPEYCAQQMSPMHVELVALLEQATTQRNARLAIAAPRGHAKSTLVALFYILWMLCYQREKFIVLVSNTLDQAAELLSHIKKELEENKLLLMDFPELCEPPGSRPGPARWRRSEIITRTGAQVTALGAGNKLRGRRNRQFRPGLFVVDDVENEESVRSEDQRKATQEWFGRAVTNAGGPGTNLIVIGTILHYDALLAHLVDPARSPGWTGKVYRAVESWAERADLWEKWEGIYSRRHEHQGQTGPDAAEVYFQEGKDEMLRGTKVLWEERESYKRLMEIRLCHGRSSFDAEKQNDPCNPAERLFAEQELRFWDDRYRDEEELLSVVARRGVLVGACDPSLGKAGRRGDDSAILTGLLDLEEGILYMLHADIRRRKPDEIIEAILAMHRRREYRAFGIETNQFQEFLASELVRRAHRAGIPLNVAQINHTKDKIGRVQRLQPMVAQGHIRFSKRHTVLLDQLRQFPHGAHDDGPDALELLCQTTGYAVPVNYGTVVGYLNL